MRMDVKNLSHSKTFANAVETMTANRPERRLTAALQSPFLYYKYNMSAMRVHIFSLFLR
jgi:hypothetical protein